MQADPPHERSIWRLAYEGRTVELKQRLIAGENLIEKVVSFNCGRRGQSDLVTMTMIGIAAWNGHHETVKMLLQNGADYTFLDGRGRTPLHIAVASGDVECANELLKWGGSDVNTEDNQRRSVLERAVSEDNLELVQLLIRFKANPFLASRNGRFALYFALPVSPVREYLENLQELLDRDFAFAAGHHHRLGEGSVVATLHPEVLRMILDQV
jgi:ankyrin repeat protein